MDKKLCPFCGEEILSVAKKCKHCGEWIETKVRGTGNLNFYEQVSESLSGLFELQEELGRGGMAVVYRAIQKSLNREVALKVLYQQYGDDDEFLQRFRREAEVSAGLKHPNIAQVYDVGEVNGINYLAMEFLDGGNLGDVLGSKGRLSEMIIFEIGQKVSSALTYIHNLGLIHRDIKSSNIMLTKDSRVMLTDFGIAYAFGKQKLSKHGDILGTPEYMSPEQIIGEKELDGRSDIYSLGIVLYECIMGRVPFEGNNVTIINKKLNEQVVLESDEINVRLLNIINRCLAKDPFDRYNNAEELMADFNLLMRKPEQNLDSKKTQKIDRTNLEYGYTEAKTSDNVGGNNEDEDEKNKIEGNEPVEGERFEEAERLSNDSHDHEIVEPDNNKVETEQRPSRSSRKLWYAISISLLLVILTGATYLFLYNNKNELPFETLNLRGEKLSSVLPQLNKVEIPIYYHFVNSSEFEPGMITQPFAITKKEIKRLRRLDIYITNEIINN